MSQCESQSKKSSIAYLLEYHIAFINRVSSVNRKTDKLLNRLLKDITVSIKLYIDYCSISHYFLRTQRTPGELLHINEMFSSASSLKQMFILAVMIHTPFPAPFSESHCKTAHTFWRIYDALCIAQHCMLIEMTLGFVPRL